MQSAPLCGRLPRLLLAATALAAVGLGTTGSVTAQETPSTTIVVTASVPEQCSLQTEEIPLDFGIYDDVQIISGALFTYNCPLGKNITFELVGGQPVNGSGIRPLPNIDVPASAPLEYIINNPSGSPWIVGYVIDGTPGGEQTVQFDGILLAGQLDAVFPGRFSDQITLELRVNN